MAPKKQKEQKMSLGDFLTDNSFGGGSWADEVEETYVTTGTQQLPPVKDGARSSATSAWQDRGYAVRESVPTKLPDRPPFTAHLGNLSYDATNESVTSFFDGCDVVSVRIIEDREMMRPKGFGYVEFTTIDGLKKALALDGQSFEGRMIKIKVADPPRGGDGRAESSRDLSDWSRKGPLPDLPGRGGPRQPADFGERRPPRDAAAEPRPARELTWERRGPLTSLPQEGPSSSRDNSRARPAAGGMGERSESYRGNRSDPAAWGEGREDRPRREFNERPERVERAPTAAERDMKWRDRMRPDSAVQLSPPTDFSETQTTPAVSNTAPGGRPRLALTKRTVAEGAEPSSTTTDSKASPFGAARPIDTAAREKEIEEKRLQAALEKREADEKAKEEKRLAKETAAKEAAAAKAEAEAEAEKAAAAAAAAEAEAEAKAKAEAEAGTEAEAAVEVKEEAEEKAAENQQNGGEQKLPIRNREVKEGRDSAQAQKSRATESGNWRSASNDQRNARGPSGSGRGHRGGGRGGPRHDNRTPRSNGASGHQTAAAGAEAEPAVDEDGWTTVPKKGRTGRPLVS